MLQPGAIRNLIGLWLERLRPLWVVLFFPAFVTLDGRYLLVGLGAIASLWLVTGLTSGVWLRRTPLDGPWLIWLAMLGVAVLVTKAPDLTRAALATFSAQAVAFWAVVAWLSSTRRAWWVAAGLVAAAVLLSLLAPFWVDFSSGQLVGLVRSAAGVGQRLTLPVDETVNANLLAGILVSLWPVALAMALAGGGERQGLRRLAAAIASLIIGVALLLTQSRGAWIAAAGSVFFLAALRWRRVWWVLPGALIGLALLYGAGYLQDLVALALQSGALAGSPERLEVWSRALYAIQDFPVTGIGLGAYGRVIPLLYPYFIISADAALSHAHNLWLQVALDLGLLGLVAFVAMILGTAWLARGALRLLALAQQTRPAWLLRGCMAGLGAVLIHGLLDATVWNTRPAFLTWALWGLAVGLSVLACEQRSRQPAASGQDGPAAGPGDPGFVRSP